MIKNNKALLIITSCITLLPIIIGIVLWNKMPDTLATHWNINGVADGWSSKIFAIFGLPLFLLIIHWVCILVTNLKSEDIYGKMLNIVLWICPVISLVCCSMVYATALGYETKIEIIMPILVGTMFIIVGNYLPKCKRNMYMGIKLPWTLKSDENWYHTHRLGGWLWMLCGVVTIFTSLLRSFWIVIVILAVAIIVPTIYSFAYYIIYEKRK